MGNNTSGGAFRGSRDDLHIDGDDGKSRPSNKKAVANKKEEQARIAAEIQQNEANEYDIPIFDDDIGPGSGSQTSSVMTATVTDAAAEAARTSAHSRKTSTDNARTGKSEKKYKSKKDKKDKRAKNDGADDNAAVGATLSSVAAGGTGGPDSEGHPGLARSESRESGVKVMASVGVRVLPAMPAIGMQQGLRKSSKENDEGNEDEDCYDHIQRDINPAKAKYADNQRKKENVTDSSRYADSAAVEYDMPSLDGHPETSCATYEMVTPCSSLSGPSSAAAAAVTGEGPAVVLASAAESGSYPEEEDCYDRIQRNVNPVKLKQEKVQKALRGNSNSPSPSPYGQLLPVDRPTTYLSATYESVDLAPSTGAATVKPRVAAVAGKGNLVLAATPSANSLDDDDGSYDCIKHDYRPAAVYPDKGLQQEVLHGLGCASPTRAGPYGSRPLLADDGAAAAASDRAAEKVSKAYTVPASTHIGRAAPALADSKPSQGKNAKLPDVYAEVKPVVARKPRRDEDIQLTLHDSSPVPQVPARLPMYTGASGGQSMVGYGWEAEPGRTYASVGIQGKFLQAENRLAAGDRGPAHKFELHSDNIASDQACGMPQDSADMNPQWHRAGSVPGYENVPAFEDLKVDAGETFESSSAFYASDQTLRGSQQPPMLTASPQLPRSTVKVRRADGSYGAAPQQCAAMAAQPNIRPMQSHVAELGAAYVDVDFTVGSPTGMTSFGQNWHAQQTHSTQDGLLVQEAKATAALSPTAPSLGAPRIKPWVHQRPPQMRYEEIDDVKNGNA